MSLANAIDVLVLTPQSILFRGQAVRVRLPGEQGIFEVLINHKPILSLLLLGEIVVDRKSIPIKRGIAKLVNNKIFAIVEESDG